MKTRSLLMCLLCLEVVINCAGLSFTGLYILQQILVEGFIESDPGKLLESKRRSFSNQSAVFTKTIILIWTGAEILFKAYKIYCQTENRLLWTNSKNYNIRIIQKHVFYHAKRILNPLYKIIYLKKSVQCGSLIGNILNLARKKDHSFIGKRQQCLL